VQVFTLIRSIAFFRKIGILLKRRLSPETSTFSGNLGFFQECFRQELRLFSNFGFLHELRFSSVLFRNFRLRRDFGFLYDYSISTVIVALDAGNSKSDANYELDVKQGTCHSINGYNGCI